MNGTNQQNTNIPEQKSGQRSQLIESKRLHAASLAEGFDGIPNAEQVLSIYGEMSRAIARDLNEQESVFALVSPAEAVSRDMRTRELHVRWVRAKEQKERFTLNDAEVEILFDEITRLTAALNKAQAGTAGPQTSEEPIISNTGARVRVLPETNPRVETGPIQFGDDWPGVFIRGDNAFHYAINLSLVLEKFQDPFIQAVLKGLLSDLVSSNLSGAKVPQSS